MKKTLDKNHFRTAQKTMDREPPSFKIGNRVYFKNKPPGKWDLKWRPVYRIVHIEHDEHYLHIENQASGKTRSCNIRDIVLEPPVEFWNIDTQFIRARKYINHPANLPTSIESLPHMPFLDHHSSCIFRKSGEAVENVHQADGKNTTTTEPYTRKAFSSNSYDFNTASRAQQFR